MEDEQHDPTLGQVLADLVAAVAEYQSAVNRMFDAHSARIDLCDRMVVELRDDTHEAQTALGNRVENLTRAMMVSPDQLAGKRFQKMMRDIRGGAS